MATHLPDRDWQAMTDLLADVHSVWGDGEEKIPAAILLSRLRELNPPIYGKWNAVTLGQAMRAMGAPTKDIKHRDLGGPWRTVKGLTRQVFLNAQPVVVEADPEVGPVPKGPVVYFAERQGFLKIGTTANLAARVGALNRGDSAILGMTIFPVNVLATMPGGLQVEQSIHKLFRDLRFEGEWFLFESPLTEFVASIAAASASGER